jgi:hypothetical protein
MNWPQSIDLDASSQYFCIGSLMRSGRSILATELFPDLADPQKTPGIALRGLRLRLELTQKEMAN